MTHNILDPQAENDLLERIDQEDCAQTAAMGIDWEPTPEQRIRADLFAQRMEAARRMQGLWNGLFEMYAMLMDYAGYVVITSVALAAAVAIYHTLWPQLTEWATFTTASIYMPLMVLEILRHNRQQQQWSLQEIGDRIDCIDNTISDLRDIVERNYV